MRLAIAAAGLAMMLWGSRYLALGVAGSERTGWVENSVRLYGESRGRVYEVSYSFSDERGERHEGSAMTGAARAPKGSLRIRVLNSWPMIHHPGTPGLLWFYAVLWILPGAAVAAVGAR